MGIITVVILLVMAGFYAVILLVSSSRTEDDEIIMKLFKRGYILQHEGEVENNRMKRFAAKMLLLICFKAGKGGKTN